MRLGVERKNDAAPRIEIPIVDIIQEEIPLFRTPNFVASMAIEADGKSRNEVEFASDRWQRFERFDPPDYPFQSKQLKHFAVEFRLIEIEPEHLVPKMLKNKEKIAGPTPNIEDIQFRTSVESKRTDVMDSVFDPGFDVGILRPRFELTRHMILLTNGIEFFSVDVAQQIFGFKRVLPTIKPVYAACPSLSGGELL